MHIHIQLYYLMRGNGNVHLIKTTTYIIAKLSWQLNSMKLSWLTTVTDGLIVSEQLFPEPPLFLSVMMGTGVVLERLVSSAFNHLMQLLAQGSFTGIKKKKKLFLWNPKVHIIMFKMHTTGPYTVPVQNNSLFTTDVATAVLWSSVQLSIW